MVDWHEILGLDPIKYTIIVQLTIISESCLNSANEVWFGFLITNT